MEEELIRYCEQMGVESYILSLDEKRSIIKTIHSYYERKDARYGFSLFDMLDFEKVIGVNLFDSWTWVHDFIKDKCIVVFFDYKYGNMVQIKCGSIFVRFYDNCPKYEFYITDREGSFLLGYNHSHCLFAMGVAADWLENSKKYKEFYK